MVFFSFKKLEEKRRKQIMTSIQKNVQQAKSTGDDKRYGQVASRKKVRQSPYNDSPPQMSISHIF